MQKRIEDLEILPGMLVKYEDIRYLINCEGPTYISHWFLVVSVNKDGSLFGYTLACSADDDVAIGDLMTVARNSIVEVVAARNYHLGNLLNTGSLLAILDDGDSVDARTLWEKPEEVLELTVSDIEEKYGCKVKIVGEQK